MNSPTTFSKNLKFLRRLKGNTQKELADVLDINRSKITAYELGFSEPNYQLLCKIAAYFQISLNELITMDLDQEASDIDIRFNQSKPQSPISKLDIQRVIHSTNDAQKYLDGYHVYADMFVENKKSKDLQNKYLQTLSALLQLNWDFISLMQGETKKEN